VSGSPTISAVVLTGDEERHIAACLRSLAWADEQLVLDGGSRDRTVVLARAQGATVQHRPFDDFAAQRQAALGLASCDWVLFVDADERVSTQLADEARVAVTGGPHAAYRVPRRNYIWGRWIRGGGWWPDAQLRLLVRDRASYDRSGPVHELADVQGSVGTLHSALVHYNYDTVGEFVRKQRRYAILDAGGRRRAGERGRPRRVLSQPVRELWRRYVALGGWRDGRHGLALATLMALTAGETQLRLL
jgi:glycosyltransferase involved in cell wall biosynthesis